MTNKKLTLNKVVDVVQIIIVFVVVLFLDSISSFITTGDINDFFKGWSNPDKLIATSITTLSAVWIKTTLYRYSKNIEKERDDVMSKEKTLHDLSLRVNNENKTALLDQSCINYNRMKGLELYKTKISNSLSKEKNRKKINDDKIKKLEVILYDIENCHIALEQKDEKTLSKLSRQGLDIDNLKVRFDKISTNIVLSSSDTGKNYIMFVDKSDKQFYSKLVIPLMFTIILSLITSLIVLEFDNGFTEWYEWIEWIYGIIISLAIFSFNAFNGWYGGKKSINGSYIPVLENKANYVINVIGVNKALGG